MKSEQKIREKLQECEKRHARRIDDDVSNLATAHVAGEVAILRWVLDKNQDGTEPKP